MRLCFHLIVHDLLHAFEDLSETLIHLYVSNCHNYLPRVDVSDAHVLAECSAPFSCFMNNRRTNFGALVWYQYRAIQEEVAKFHLKSIINNWPKYTNISPSIGFNQSFRIDDRLSRLNWRKLRNGPRFFK